MIKDLIQHLGYSFFGNLSLVMFLVIFIAVSLYALSFSREESEQQANVVLDDLENRRS